jgi:hypothetical protein
LILQNFYAFTKSILNPNRSIRWVGITDQNGIIINEWYREGLRLILTIEETHEFAINTITRHKTRLKFEPKMGELTYSNKFVLNKDKIKIKKCSLVN